MTHHNPLTSCRLTAASKLPQPALSRKPTAVRTKANTVAREPRTSTSCSACWQPALYADDRYALLLVFQAMDAAGKDSTIRSVMQGVDPSGCQVFSFKKPSDLELDHDFLWRTTCRLPERGSIRA